MPLYHLTSVFEGWTPVYIPINDNKIEDQILYSTGIIDLDLLHKVRDEIYGTGIDLSKKAPGDGYVILMKNIIPQNYPTDRIYINWRENRITLWPIMKLQTELNIPTYRWRIFHLVKDQRYLIADWPVIVGKRSTRTRVAALPMNQLEHYPPWTDPETGDHSPPGPRNPLGIWKLKSTHTRRLWYYHGTNRPRLLKRKYRALSHGCIRNDNNNIARLAKLLLSHDAGDEVHSGYVAGRLDIVPQRKFRKIPLVIPVDASNFYDTIEVSRKEPVSKSILTFYPDVYRGRVDAKYLGYRLSTLEHLYQELHNIGVPSNILNPITVQEALYSARKIKYDSISVEVKKLLKEGALKDEVVIFSIEEAVNISAL